MKISLRQIGDVNVLDLDGRFDSDSAGEVQQWFQELKTRRVFKLIVNLKKVDFVDSTALSTLVQAMKHAREQEGDLRLAAMQQTVRIIFELTRLDRVFEIYPSVDDALGAF